jgi:hypothetical protein
MDTDPPPDPPTNPLGRARCQAPAGFDGSPRTIEDAVALLDGLPKPTSVACFVESLARPLAIYAVDSVFSAQPALSAQSPRVFIKIDQLWLSVVVDGDSSYLLEFGYRPSDAVPTSIKGELAFPLTEVIPPSAPFDRVRDDNGTVCGACHYSEERVEDVSFAEAFASVAFRPRPESRVPVETLRAESAACDWSVNPHRCEMLSAIFDGGTVNEAPFPDDLPTFY